MRAIFKFVAGNSVVTPIGVAAAALAAASLHGDVPWISALFVFILALTLVISTFERV